MGRFSGQVYTLQFLSLTSCIFFTSKERKMWLLVYLACFFFLIYCLFGCIWSSVCLLHFHSEVTVCGPYGLCVCPVGVAHVTLSLLSRAFDQIIAPQTRSFQPLSVTMETGISASCVEWLLVVSAWPPEWLGYMSSAHQYNHERMWKNICWIRGKKIFYPCIVVTML